MSLETQHIRTYCRHILNQSFQSGDSQLQFCNSMLIIIHFPRQNRPPHTHVTRKSVKSMQDMTTPTKPKHENTYMLIYIYNS